MPKKTTPLLTTEKRLWRKGYALIGVDEVGVGPLAGPVVAAAFMLRQFPIPKPQFPRGIRDSKRVVPRRREQIFGALTSHPAVRWGVGVVSPKTIDRLNIYKAGLLAMKKAVARLMRKHNGKLNKRWYLHIDGRGVIPGLIMNQKCIVRGDAKIFSIACASIIAKVTRDRMMVEYAKQYPKYKFNKHKGYGTKLHFALLKKHGPCPLHRKGFLKFLRIKSAA